MTKEEKIYQKWLAAGISDNFIFSKTMEAYLELCKELIEKILHIKICRIEYPEREKVIEERLDSKGSRLDVYVEDDSNRSFDLEMQISEVDNLEKRMRYYQGLLDLDKLKRGTRYRTLGESYIIFICLFDYFGKGRQIYTFCERCEEDLTLILNDGATKIFLNTESLADTDKDLSEVLNYIAGRGVSGRFSKELDEAVQNVKFGEKARLEFMTFELLVQEREERAHAEGREEGRIENKIEMVKNLLLAKTPLKYIMAATGWSEERILKLANDN